MKWPHTQIRSADKMTTKSDGYAVKTISLVNGQVRR